MWESGHGWMNCLRISGSIMNDVLYSCRLPREQIIPEYIFQKRNCHNNPKVMFLSGIFFLPYKMWIITFLEERPQFRLRSFRSFVHSSSVVHSTDMRIIVHPTHATQFFFSSLTAAIITVASVNRIHPFWTLKRFSISRISNE